jgi:hypothetical protein
VGQIGRFMPHKTACENERQDYAARFGLSSERFEQLFETAFLRVT